MLGNGSTSSSPTPTAVVGLPSAAKVTALTSSGEGSGALLSNGMYYNWGYNAAGQLGNGTTADCDLPVRVDLPTAVRQVSQGSSGATNGQTVAILRNGSVWSWGNNKKGQLGDGSRVNADVPVQVNVPAGVTFVKFNSGGYSCYPIDRSGRLWAWGGNDNGQLGTGSRARVETHPVDVAIHLTQVSSTASTVAGLRGSSKGRTCPAPQPADRARTLTTPGHSDNGGACLPGLGCALVGPPHCSGPVPTKITISVNTPAGFKADEQNVAKGPSWKCRSDQRDPKTGEGQKGVVTRLRGSVSGRFVSYGKLRARGGRDSVFPARHVGRRQISPIIVTVGGRLRGLRSRHRLDTEGRETLRSDEHQRVVI